MNKKGSKHLLLIDRLKIQELLDDNETCLTIASLLAKDPRIISNEVKNRRSRIDNNRYGLYGKFDNFICDRWTRFPFVCNGCSKRKTCFNKFKFFYNANQAQDNYNNILHESRKGLDITPEDMTLLNKTLSDGISKGQSINHIVMSNPSNIRYSVRSVYRLIDNGQCDVKSIDLRRKVKLKPRKRYISTENNKKIREGISYADFIPIISKNPFLNYVQMDTVESVSSGIHKCLLTIHFPLLHFMLISVLDRRTKDEVTKAFLRLKDKL